MAESALANKVSRSDNMLTTRPVVPSIRIHPHPNLLRAERKYLMFQQNQRIPQKNPETRKPLMRQEQIRYISRIPERKQFLASQKGNKKMILSNIFTNPQETMVCCQTAINLQANLGSLGTEKSF
jgi:hypothetical protein